MHWLPLTPPMEPIVEHQPKLAGVQTRAIELEGDRREAVALDCPGFGSVTAP